MSGKSTMCSFHHPQPTYSGATPSSCLRNAREYGWTLKDSERGRGLVCRVVSDHEAGAGPLLESPDRLLGCWIDPAQLAFAPPSLPPQQQLHLFLPRNFDIEQTAVGQSSQTDLLTRQLLRSCNKAITGTHVPIIHAHLNNMINHH